MEKILDENLQSQTEEQPEFDENSYKVKLENFEGPLDLLLHLVKESKMDIEDVKLADLTCSYLQYLEELSTIDLQLATDFISVAATLIEIKSKALLPKLDNEEDDEEDKENLIKIKLKEYALFKETFDQIKAIENTNKFYREPDPSAADYRIVLKQMNMENLISAFTKLMEKAKTLTINEVDKTIERDRWTVDDKIFEIRTIMQSKEKRRFNDLVDEDFTKSEVINLFLAILELLKLQEIKVMQDNLFGDIFIEKNLEIENKEEMNDNGEDI